MMSSHRDATDSEIPLARKAIIVGLALSAAALTACGGGTTGTEVTAASFGSSWPLTVPSGTLSCEGSSSSVQSVVFTAPDGTQYGVNGTAQSVLGLPSIDPIWQDESGGLKKDMGPLIDKGRSLCAP